MFPNASQLLVSGKSNAISAVGRSLVRVDAEAWNSFARAAGASLHGSHRQIFVWQLRRMLTHQVRVLECFFEDASGPRKIAQCAVGMSRRGGLHSFLDGVHLAPGDEARWLEVMCALLEVLGDGEYKYGWVLSLEPRRESLLQTIAGVELRSTREIVVQAVDFKRWTNWPSYYRAISENSKRSAKAARRDLPDLSIDIRSGRAAAAQAKEAARLNDAMARRKGLPTSLRRSQARYAFGVIAGGQAYTIALARAGDRVLSCYFGAEFGALTYYLEGGSDDQNAGGAWCLILTMLERAYERDPQGRFIMGHIDYSTHDDDASGGLLRSRKACRVSDFETSVVRFRYRRGASRTTVTRTVGNLLDDRELQDDVAHV